jgi:hypothetical protein
MKNVRLEKGSYLILPYLLAMDFSSHVVRFSRSDAILTLTISRDISNVASKEEIIESVTEYVDALFARKDNITTQVELRLVPIAGMRPVYHAYVKQR